VSFNLSQLAYAGDDLSMLVLLPSKVDGLGQLEAELTMQSLTSWTENLQNHKVDVFLPKFKMTSKFLLAGTLAALGMSDAFTGQADFSGMDGRKDLLISDVIHKAFVEVNEEGTEAAAATAVVMFGGAAPSNPQPIPVFRVDHPFLFLIRDNRNGSVLFLGRVMDPTQSE
jgi:serpin B